MSYMTYGTYHKWCCLDQSIYWIFTSPPRGWASTWGRRGRVAMGHFLVFPNLNSSFCWCFVMLRCVMVIPHLFELLTSTCSLSWSQPRVVLIHIWWLDTKYNSDQLLRGIVGIEIVWNKFAFCTLLLYILTKKCAYVLCAAFVESGWWSPATWWNLFCAESPGGLEWSRQACKASACWPDWGCLCTWLHDLGCWKIWKSIW